MASSINPDVLIAQEDIPEAGLIKGDTLHAPPGKKPLLLRVWRGNPGLLLNLACDSRLKFAGEDGAEPPPDLRLLN